MNTWTEQREREIRERIQNASPLPWVQDDDPMLDILEDPTGEIVEYLDFSSEPDATLLANAPQDLSDALDEIARLRSQFVKDDATIERLALALLGGHQQEWEGQSEEIRRDYRGWAETLLDVIANAGGSE